LHETVAALCKRRPRLHLGGHRSPLQQFLPLLLLMLMLDCRKPDYDCEHEHGED
jgi:hypothetical protein